MRFSIVTPSFNGGAWLSLCVASVADQQVELEHLIQDGGSTDGSLEGLNQPHLRVAREPDAGMYDAVNRGIRRAEGEILGYLNCDEQYLPGALQAVDRFFTEQPRVEMVFGDAVIVDADGLYLWHRKMLVPTKRHTWTCPLSVLTCGTFFRRSLVERGLVFDSSWKVCGDSAWMLGLLKAGVSMRTLGVFTSAFTHTGKNLSLDPRSAREAERFFASAPARLRLSRLLILAEHRLRRWRGGIYRQEPFDFEIYTRSSPAARVRRHVADPTYRWRW